MTFWMQDRPPARLPMILSLLAVLIAGGCGGNVLISKTDQTYARSIERLARTKRQVEAMAPAGEDAVMFMQAEALYRYRFAPPGRHAGSYLAQGAAAAIDLPVLQAYASSLDLFDLRLHANDGAIQVWESMLQRHPESPLKPLTLYRLGWAYRYRITPGFPRNGPQEALDELIQRHPASALAPLAKEMSTIPWKSQGRATGLSIVPGLGQIYAGERFNGAVRLSVAAVAAGMVFAPAIVGYSRWRDDQLKWKQDWPLLATAVGGLILFSVDYTLAYQDTLRAVMQSNEREEDAFEDRHPEAP